MIRSRRRLFLFAAGTMLAVPLVHAQQSGRIYRIGILVASSLPHPSIPALPNRLKELGYIEGRNIAYEVRVAQGRAERNPELIAELLALKIDVLMVSSSQSAKDAQKATRTIPIVFAGVFDPLGSGVVSSLARPGGNVTGTSYAIGGEGFAGKWLHLLKEVVPNLSHAAALWNPFNPGVQSYLEAMNGAARKLGVKLDLFEISNAANLDKALAAIGGRGHQGLIVTSDPFMATQREKLVGFAASKRIPAIYFQKAFVDTGGLISYGGSFEDSWERAASHVDRILRGAKPGELPVDQPTRFELAVNLKVARTLGLVIPRSILVVADRVIE